MSLIVNSECVYVKGGMGVRSLFSRCEQEKHKGRLLPGHPTKAIPLTLRPLSLRALDQKYRSPSVHLHARCIDIPLCTRCFRAWDVMLMKDS